MTYYTEFTVSLCGIVLVGDEAGLNYLHLETGEGKDHFKISKEWIENKKFFTKEIKQIKEYAQGKRKTFDIKLNMQGTDFQKRVWKALCTIPFGKTASYKDIAIKIGNDKACRAIGMANGRNPIPIIVPCHRIINANGELGGFSSGLKIKRELLELEGV